MLKRRLIGLNVCIFKCNSAPWYCIANRNRPASLFMAADVSPASSSSDRVDVRLQGYQKNYGHQQQVFSQQQGTVRGGSPVVSTWHQQPSFGVVPSIHPCFVRCFFQGCLYGEGKVVQPVSDGGFEPASYLTNPSTSHSTGTTAIVALASTVKRRLKPPRTTPWTHRHCAWQFS